MTSVRHIPARSYSQPPPPKRTIDPSDPDLLIPIQLSTGNSVQDREEIEAGEANDTSKAHSPPSQPCGQLQAQRSDSSSSESIAHCSTNTPSQREIFSHNNRFEHFRTPTSSQREIFSQNSNYRTPTPSQREIFSPASTSSSSVTGTETDIAEELHTPSQSESEATVTTSSSDYTSTSQTASDYDASSETSSRETSRPSSPESGNLTVKSVYSPLPEMTIVHRMVHYAIHAVRE